MARKMSREDQNIVSTLKKLPVKEEETAAWIEIIESGNMNEELAKEMVTKLEELTPEEESEQLAFSRKAGELNRVLQAWRLKKNLRSIDGRRGRG